MNLKIANLKGKLWIGTLNGVFKVDEKSLGITSYNISTGLSHNSVGYIYKHKEVFQAFSLSNNF